MSEFVHMKSKFCTKKVDGEIERWSFVVTRDGVDTTWWQGIVKDKHLTGDQVAALSDLLHDFWTKEFGE